MGARAKSFKTIILKDLKKAGREDITKHITSVKYKSYSGGDSVNVDSVNLLKADREFLDNFLKDYQDGHFDGMTDCYEYKKCESTKERTAKYVFLRNEFTSDIKEKVKEDLKNKFDVYDDKTSMAVFNTWYDTLIWRTLNEL